MIANTNQPTTPYQSASLYVGDLKPEVNETRLFELFTQVGPVASIRICRDAVTRMSLGYGYVNFHNVQDADRAIDTMNFQAIDGRPCRIMWSQRDPMLRKSGVGNIFVKNLAPSIDNKDMYDLFSEFGNILSCKVVTDAEGQSKGYGYIHFETGEAAETAIAKLNGTIIDDTQVYVGHFVKRMDRSNTNDFTNLYVKMFPEEWTEDKLEEVFAEHGEISSVSIMRDEDGRSKRFGFVNFKEHQQAEAALEALHGKLFDADKPSPPALKDLNEDGEEGDESDDGAKNEDAEGEPAPKAEGEKSEEVANPEADDAEKEGEEKPQEIKMGWELYVSRFQKKLERTREMKQKADENRNERITKYQGMNLYVKNLDDNVTDEQFNETFAPYGTITSARIMRDPENKMSRGFGFVCYSSPEEATRAVAELNGKLINGKPIVVTLHQRKEQRRAHLAATYGARAGRGPGFMNQQPMYNGMPYMMNPQMRQQQPFPMMGMMNPRPPRGALPSQYRQQSGSQGYGGPMGPNNQNGMPWMQQPPRGRIPQGVNNQGRPGQGSGPATQPQQRMGGPQPGRSGMPGRGMPSQPMPGRPGGASMKFTGQVRNQPMMGMPMMPGMPAPGMQGGPMPPQAAPLVPKSDTSLDQLTVNLAQQEVPVQKNMIGERLYPLIHRTHPELAGKITGMLLEMDNAELLHLLEEPQALDSKIEEAMSVLNQHNKAQTAEE